jgi:hypothetical protein
MITPETYLRRTFEIEAVRITHDNISEVAKWCLAEEKTQTRPAKKGEGSGYVQEVPYLKVDVLRPLNERQTMAFIGDWILKTGTSFKIYTDIAFHKNFVKKETYDDVLLPENEAEFMVLRNGTWELMSPEELKEKFAPIVRATLDDIQHEKADAMYEREIAMAQEIAKQPTHPLEETGVPQVRLARRPPTSEIPSD